MPTYQYRCTECGNDLEAVQKFSDDPLTECPACGGPLRKVYSAVGIVFKGSGFYATDSKSKKSSASPAADKSTPAPAAKPTESPRSSDASTAPSSTGSDATA